MGVAVLLLCVIKRISFRRKSVTEVKMPRAMTSHSILANQSSIVPLRLPDPLAQRLGRAASFRGHRPPGRHRRAGLP